MIYLHAALAAEARPLIDHYRLRSTAAGAPFRLYAGEEVGLVVSGMGKAAAAAALAYAHARAAPPPSAWLNIGIAGHGQADVGTPLLAHKVVDAASGRTFYPAFAFRLPCATSTVLSLDRPAADYAPRAAFDMELSAFVETAQRFLSAELAHGLKIVSDNPRAHWRQLQRHQVAAWIGQHLALIDALVAELQALGRAWAAQRAAPPHLEDGLRRWRFTAAQRQQLRRLLRQWQALAPQSPPWPPDADLPDAGAALAFLGRRLAEPERAPRYV